MKYLLKFLFVLILTISLESLSNNNLGIYIHIPFCRRRCFYCDFPIQIIGNRKSTIEQSSLDYTQLLLHDIQLTCDQPNDVEETCLQSNESDHFRLVDSIYFGGGTPSLLHPIFIERIILGLKKYFVLTDDCEITMEADPGTFNIDYLHQLEDIGINRLSIGLQSFNDTILIKCGRPHTLADSLRAIETVHRTSFQSNFNIDIISSLPEVTMEDWKDTLKQAIDVDSTHISVYDLQIEEKTAFGRWYSPGIYPLPTEDVATNMYSTAVETLTNARFEHYEVSNYAKEGKRSRHNQKYWSCSDVLAFGNGAASLVDGKRQIRPRTMAQYSDWLKKDRSAKEFILETTEVDLLERVMLALRTADGLNLEYITENYGEDTCRVIESVLTPYISSGHVRLNPSSINSKNIGLTDPLGFLLSNTIISDVFAVLS